jgi:hypothetical protein
MPEDAGMKTDAGAIALDENGFIPGTSYKSVDDLVKGHQNLKEMADRQGSELGSLRSQSETLANVLKEQLTKNQQPVQEKGVDYGAELSVVRTQLDKLDPMEDGYQAKHGELISKLTTLTAQAQHEKTLAVAGDMFKKELSDRDEKAALDIFYRDNPTFNTPETQTRIKQFLASDKTGMHDKFSAYFQIQRDDIAAIAAAKEKENEDMRKILELTKGREEAGKVITNGQGAGLQQTNTTKLTGKDLDAGMKAALAAAKT